MVNDEPLEYTPDELNDDIIFTVGGKKWTRDELKKIREEIDKEYEERMARAKEKQSRLKLERKTRVKKQKKEE